MADCVGFQLLFGKGLGESRKVKVILGCLHGCCCLILQ